VRDGLGDAGLAATGRSVKQERAEAILRDEPREQAVGLEDVFLPDDFGETARPHARGERLVCAGAFFGLSGRSGRGLFGEKIRLVSGGHGVPLISAKPDG
jgi:hypothetical protein